MLVVVSDLHLSEGRRPSRRKLAPTEDFFFDDEFARFLSYLHGADPGNVHLIINGDMFDFLQVGVDGAELVETACFDGLAARQKDYICGYGAKTDEQSSIFKLDKIRKGHPVFFEALAAFLERGNKLTIIIGNHDIELSWPGVQDRFKAFVCAREPAVAADGGVFNVNADFSPWIYFDRDHSVYVEHGNQYESLNSFKYLLFPVLPKRPSELNLPFGSLFVRYLLNQVEERNPFADNIKPNTKYVAWAMKNDPLGFRRLGKLLWRFCVAMAKIYRRSGNLSLYGPAETAAFEAETSRRLAALTEIYGLPGDAAAKDHPLRRIIGLHQAPFNSGRLRFLWLGFFANLDVLMFLLGGLAGAGFLFLIWEYGIRNVITMTSLGVSVFGVVAGNIFFQAGAQVSKANRAAAGKIADILRDAGCPAKYIVFGHTHEPDVTSIGADRLYFNSGTWGVIFNDEEELIREKKQFAFVVIDRPGDEPKLMRWNDGLGAPESLPLFDFPEVV